MLCFKVYGVVLFVVLVEHSGAVFQNVCVVCNDTTLFMPQHGVVYALPATMMDALFPSPQQPALQKLAGLTVHAIQSHVPILLCLCPAPSSPFPPYRTCRPHPDSPHPLSRSYLKYDPNFADDMEEDEGAGGSDDEDDDM